MFGDLPIGIEIVTWVSALAAGVVGFTASRNRGRRPWPWAMAAFLLVVPTIIVLQARSDSTSGPSVRWWPHFLLAGFLVGASVFVDQAPVRSQHIAAFEARAMDSWFSDRALMAEGPVLRGSEAVLSLPGNFSRPLVLGFVGAAFGALMIRRTFLSALALGLAGAVLGTAAWFAVITTATGDWLNYQTEVP